ncbi:unnamed protein product [Phytophthora fragariaefolia]|uniref:Unnamed protein product n=1 Tax=Phytophthora fragariaefolia TaxID=1490495 RepID=A0A9W6X6N4_9STRA|nr:unnamed protein product [Phytophthora fragariaefolia]
MPRTEDGAAWESSTETPERNGLAAGRERSATGRPDDGTTSGQGGGVAGEQCGGCTDGQDGSVGVGRDVDAAPGQDDGATAAAQVVRADGSAKVRAVTSYQGVTPGLDEASICEQVKVQLAEWRKQAEADGHRQQNGQVTDEEAHLAAINQAVLAEQRRRDEVAAKALREKATELRGAAAVAHEEARHGEAKEIKLDTGAQFSVAGEEWHAYGGRQNVLPPVDYVEGFTGALAKVLVVWRIAFRTQYDQLMVVDALVVSGATTEFLLGEDWMLTNGVNIDFTACEMKWWDDDNKTSYHSAAAAKSQEARKQYEWHGAYSESHGKHLPVCGAGGGGARWRHGVVRVSAARGTTLDVGTNADDALGTWAPTTDDMDVKELAGGLTRDGVMRWLQELGGEKKPLSNEGDLDVGDMSSEDKELLMTLVRHYPTLLEPREGCPSATTLGVEHEIHIGMEAPIKVRPRRHAQQEHETIDGQVEEMLKNGVIEESHGAWGFPVVLVKKKDGSVRFTSLDLHSGNWQVPVAEKDRDKTGFVTRRGLFRFVRMPFGLANAPGTFQRMMDAVLRGLTWQTCLVYLDGVIIFTMGDVTRHVVELAAVLERLSKAGLSLKARKCTFTSEKLEYLGHELDAEGVRPMGSLVDSVQRFPEPTDATEGKRFVHMTGFHRRFIPNFGSKAAPMTWLLRKDAVWRWAEPQQEAFEELKKALTGRPVLAYPDFSRPFKLVMDASQVGLGAALTQDQDALSRAPVKAVVAGQRAREAPELYGGEIQITEAEIKSEQARDKAVKRLSEKGRYGASIIEVSYGLVCKRNEHGGSRVVLPSTLWAKALREHHASIFACHPHAADVCANRGSVLVNGYESAREALGASVSRLWVTEVESQRSSATATKPGGGRRWRWALGVAGPLPLTADAIAIHRAVHCDKVGHDVRADAGVGYGWDTRAEWARDRGTGGFTAGEADDTSALPAGLVGAGRAVSPHMEGHGVPVRGGGAERLGSVVVMRSLRLQRGPAHGYAVYSERANGGAETSSAGFDNWSLVREDNDEHMIVHSSFMVSCRYPSDSLGSVADRILRELADEDAAAEESEMRSDEAMVAQNETDESTATESRQQEETGNQPRGISNGTEQGANEIPVSEETRPDEGGFSGTTGPGLVVENVREAGEVFRPRQQAESTKEGSPPRQTTRRTRDDHDPDGMYEDETRGEPRDTGMAVEMARGRGRPRQQEPIPVLLQVATARYIVERARRMVLNQAGRYVVEHEVKYSERPGMQAERRWLSAEMLEELRDAGKVEDDLAAGDGV